MLPGLTGIGLQVRRVLECMASSGYAGGKDEAQGCCRYGLLAHCRCCGILPVGQSDCGESSTSHLEQYLMLFTNVSINAHAYSMNCINAYTFRDGALVTGQ